MTCGAAPPLKTGPARYPATHPLAAPALEGAVVIQEYDRAERMHTPQAHDTIRDVWYRAPLKDWLDAHVGKAEVQAEPEHRQHA